VTVEPISVTVRRQRNDDTAHAFGRVCTFEIQMLPKL
jgi:hypothetical protein